MKHVNYTAVLHHLSFECSMPQITQPYIYMDANNIMIHAGVWMIYMNR